jgi:hypothetical protein
VYISSHLQVEGGLSGIKFSQRVCAALVRRRIFSGRKNKGNKGKG